MIRILVTGVTGTFGAAVADILQETGVPVRVLVRDPVQFKGTAAEVAVGDFADSRSLDTALSGIESAFLASFDRPEMPAVHRKFIEAACRQGVRHIARISSMGVDDPRLGAVMADHAEGERELERSGISYTHLRPSWVLQNFLPTSAATPVRAGKIRLPAGEGRVGFVDARDVAAVAAVVLTQSGHADRTYELTGPEARSHADVAQVLSDVTGRSITYENIPPDSYIEELTDAGWPSASIASMDTLFSEVRSGGWAQVTHDVAQVIGRRPFGIRDFARAYARIFADTQ